MIDMRREIVEKTIQTFIDPYLQQDWISAKAVKNIDIQSGKITVDIVLGYPALGVREVLQQKLTKILQDKTTLKDVTVNISWQIVSHQVQAGLHGLKGVKNIIAVGSGKGGVGKSTLSVNLALALQAEGAKVGILDADIYGPSQPQMLGSYAAPESKDQKSIEPVIRHGLQSMSIGYLVDSTQAMIWRGPMVSGALQQLLNDTQWQDLDYLIIDLPPGTGDIQLTLSQKVPVSAAVVVTTPQDLSLLDARRAVAMFRKVNIPVLGIVENMSIYHCPNCGHSEAVFGSGGGAKMAAEYQLDLLGQLPLDARIREQTDQGTPPVAVNPESDIAKLYREIARKVAGKLSLRTKNFNSRFPKIVIENN